MSEWYKPTPYSSRPSQNLTPWNYVKDYAWIYSLPLVGKGAGILLGKTTNAGPFMTALYVLAGFAVGGVTSAFVFWKKDERKRLQVQETLDSVKEVSPLHRTNDDLKKENALLQDMIEFEQNKTASIQKQQSPTFTEKLASQAERTEQDTGISAILL